MLTAPPSPPSKWTKKTQGGWRGAVRCGRARRSAAAGSTCRSRAGMFCRCVESTTKGGEEDSSSMSAAVSSRMWKRSAGANSCRRLPWKNREEHEAKKERRCFRQLRTYHPCAVCAHNNATSKRLSYARHPNKQQESSTSSCAFCLYVKINKKD